MHPRVLGPLCLWLGVKRHNYWRRGDEGDNGNGGVGVGCDDAAAAR